MIKITIEAHVFYRHDPIEVAGLSTATIPLADHIKAVSTPFDRAKFRQILGGEYFRLKEADRMRCLLLRATRHARAHLRDYFPMMRDNIMANAEQLETAVDTYWKELRRKVLEVLPTR